LPTDTLPGLSAAASARSAVERISALKGINDVRNYILLVASTKMAADHVVSFGCIGRAVLDRVWPAPVTVVLPARAGDAGWVGDTIALRVPDLAPLRDFIADLGEPVVSTSVNRTGKPPLRNAGDIEDEFGDDVDMIIARPEATGMASTIVDGCGDEVVVLRRGDYDWEAATGDSNPSK